MSQTLLENMYPVSALSQGKAASILASVTDGNPAVILKNNSPYRVVMTPDEFVRMSEYEEDLVLMALAVARLSEPGTPIPAADLYAELGITSEDLASSCEEEAL